MDDLLKNFALHCGLSLSHYWHLRLVLSITLGPLLGIFYLVLFERRAPQPTYTLWISGDGRLVARRQVQALVNQPYAPPAVPSAAPSQKLAPTRTKKKAGEE